MIKRRSVGRLFFVYRLWTLYCKMHIPLFFTTESSKRDGNSLLFLVYAAVRPPITPVSKAFPVGLDVNYSVFALLPERTFYSFNSTVPKGEGSP